MQLNHTICFLTRKRATSNQLLEHLSQIVVFTDLVVLELRVDREDGGEFRLKRGFLLIIGLFHFVCF